MEAVVQTHFSLVTLIRLIERGPPKAILQPKQFSHGMQQKQQQQQIEENRTRLKSHEWEPAVGVNIGRTGLTSLLIPICVRVQE